MTPIPNVADEITMLRALLDHQRDVMRAKAAGLDEAQLSRTHPPSSLTLGGLLKHLAMVEDYWCSEMWLGAETNPRWAGVDWDADPDWEFNSAADDDGGTLRAWFDESVAASNAILDRSIGDGGDSPLDGLSARSRRGERFNLRWVITHLIEEYARHNGHADLIREAIDGAVG